MNEEKVKTILEKCDSMHMLDEAITDHDTFKQLSEYIKYQKWTMLNFRIKQTKSLAFTKMIEVAMINGWVLDILHVRDGFISGGFGQISFCADVLCR